MKRELDIEERAEAQATFAGGCLTLVITIFLCALMLLVGCKSPKEIVREVTVIETHDSIHFVHDTLYFDVPVQTAQIVTKDSASVLENDWAKSQSTRTALCRTNLRASRRLCRFRSRSRWKPKHRSSIETGM